MSNANSSLARAAVSDTERVYLRGSVIKAPRDWVRKAYGEEFFQNALRELSADEQEMITGQILASSQYPIDVWDRFLAACRSQARRLHGESEHEFDMRNLRESTAPLVRSLYKFILGFFGPESVINKLPAVYSRIYSQGVVEIVENKPNRAVVRCADAHPCMRENLSHHFHTSLILLLEMNGVKSPQGRITREEIVNGRLVLEATVEY